MPSPREADIARRYARDYRATREPRLVAVARATYLTVTSRGELGSARFESAADLIYGAARQLRHSMQSEGRAFVPGPIEAVVTHRGLGGRWGTPRLLLRIPDGSRLSAAPGAATEVEEQRVGVEQLEEGLCVQALVIGTAERRREALVEMAEVARLEGLTFQPLLHLVFLTDPRRATPIGAEAIILRQPLRHAVVMPREHRRPLRVEWQQLGAGAGGPEDGGAPPSPAM